ncbi:uncharacterized protein RSE6_01128 [Rhynchosporium secalis]|uniref:Heterokaryon incompatibility domain-containing protein n=1 Tax=Rhynchosporium secalis TaxID=38038 RepID=A0A1E1LWY9_RHYSE|nr:uncharacterized protein RSE6_01128 [Rhynchosporium secalis]
MEIIASLDLALRHIRDPIRVIRIWADGVCINQQNGSEKSQRVAQMGLIYETAHHTIIFLGLATERSELLVRALNSTGILSNRNLTDVIFCEDQLSLEALLDAA